MKKVTNLALIMLISVGLFSCSDDDSDSNAQTDGTASLKLEMVDAPGDYEHVYVDVEDVVLKYSGEENEVSIGNINAGVYDLLELTGGASVILVDNDIPAGDLEQIRLILGDDNSVVVDGQTFPLATPSAQQSGLKLNINTTLENDEVYEFILDFDVDASIVTQGNGGYSLKPVIRAEAAANVGSIVGTILPAGIVQTSVTASNGSLEVTSYTNVNGEFMLYALPEGMYDVTVNIDPELGLPPIVIEGVQVSANSQVTIDPIDLDIQ